MSFNKLKSSSYCVGGKHVPAANNIQKRKYSNKRKHEHTVNFQEVYVKHVKAINHSLYQTKLSKKYSKNPGRALEIAAKMVQQQRKIEKLITATALDYNICSSREVSKCRCV